MRSARTLVAEPRQRGRRLPRRFFARDPVVVAPERKVKDKDQRVVVTGGSSFLSNQFIGLLNNVDLGTNILNWLSEYENLITIQPRARVDSSLELSRPQLTLIVTLFLALLPVAFLVAGGMIWWRRRRA